MKAAVTNPTVTILVHHNRIRLVETYKPDDLCEYTIPAGFISDGASIPRALWSTIGSPFYPKFIPAALYHDYLLSLSDPSLTKSYIDKEFHRLLLANGVSKFRARLMFWAVRSFGKRKRRSKRAQS